MILENIIKQLNEIKNLKDSLNEIFLPSEDDYTTYTDKDSYNRSKTQKMNWKKHRNKYMKGIDSNARNNYKQGIYSGTKTKDNIYSSGMYSE